MGDGGYGTGSGRALRGLRTFFQASGAAERCRSRALIAALAAAAATLGLAGCGSMADRVSETVADAPLIGVPANAPARPATKLAYPNVHDMPPARPATLSDAEQQKMEDELVAARTRQQAFAPQPPPPSPPPAVAEPKPAARKKPPATPAATQAPSGASIY
jgi:hypothetical protein